MVASVAFSFLLHCVAFFAQEVQPLEPQEALRSIVSLSATERAKAFSIVQRCDTGTARILSQMLMGTARKSYDAGDLGKSAFLYECAVEAARESKHDGLLVEGTSRLGTTLLQLRDYRRAEVSLQEAVRLSEKQKLDMALINNLGMLGVLYIRLAKYDAAERVSKERPDAHRGNFPNRTPVQYRYGEAVVSGNLGAIAARNGEYTDALHYFRRAVELFETIGHGDWRLQVSQHWTISLVSAEYTSISATIERHWIITARHYLPRNSTDSWTSYNRR